MKNLKSKKTIHVFTRYFYPVVAGMEINILNTYSNFVKKGWDVTIHTTKDMPYEKNILPEKEIINKMTIKRYARESYPFRVLRGEIYKNGNLLVLHDLDISGQILIYIKTLLLKLLGFKKYSFIFSSHGLFNYGSNVYPEVKIKIRIFIQNTVGVFLINKCVDSIRVVSNFEKKGLIKAGIKASLITVIANGLEKEAFMDVERVKSEEVKSNVKKNGNYIIQVGRIDRVKNYEVVIRALEKLPNEIKYIIIGDESDYGYKKELLTLIKDLDLENRVIFLGVIRGLDKYYFMKHALAMVHLSRAEGFGNSVNEALSQGTICIVSKDTALTEFVRDNINGFHVQMDDYEDLVKKIMFIYKNKNSSFIRNMGRRDKKTFLDNSWSDIAEKVESFYLKTLTQK